MKFYINARYLIVPISSLITILGNYTLHSKMKKREIV